MLVLVIKCLDIEEKEEQYISHLSSVQLFEKLIVLPVRFLPSMVV